MLGHEQWWIRFVALVYVVCDFIFFGFVLANVDIPLLNDYLNNELLRSLLYKLQHPLLLIKVSSCLFQSKISVLVRLFLKDIDLEFDLFFLDDMPNMWNLC